MRVEKEKCKVCIVCEGGILVKGFIHLNPGERVSDFLNNSKGNFIAVTEVEFYDTKEVESFKLFVKISRKRNAVVLNKLTIKLIEQL